MKQIVVALSRNPLNQKELIQAFKVFAKHNPDLRLTVFGTEKQLNILKGNEEVDIAPASAEEVMKKACGKAAIEPESALIVLGSRKDLLAESAAHLQPKAGRHPVLGVFIPTRVYNRSVFFLDLGANLQPDDAYLKECLEDALFYEEKIVSSKKNRYTLLYPGKPAEGTVSFHFDENAKTDPAYAGTIDPGEILEGKSEIVLGESPLIVSALEGAKGSIAAIYETGRDEISKSAFFKFGLWWLKDVQKTITNRFDRKLYGNGLILFGYPFPIIGLEESTTFGGISKALETAKRWLYAKQ